MPYDLFWHGPISAYLQYRAAYYKRLKEHEKDLNRAAWYNGAYVSRAIASSFDSKKNPYPKSPIRRLTPEEERKRQATADMIEKHNVEMRQIQQEQAIKLQKQLDAQKAEAISHGGRTDH